MKKFSYYLILLFFLLVGSLFLSSAETNTSYLPSSVQAQNETEPDALAVRVLPNSEHADPLRWYKDRGIGGDPKRLTVDGYNAVRDGRTVYVNVGNVVNGNFYTNIYVLSYTQEATANTVEIFNRLLNNFDFNSNLIDGENDLGYCTISTQNCTEDKDCPSNYKCSDNWKCVPQEAIRCYRDSECPGGIYCDSNKAEVIRDTERLAQMREIERLAEEYKKKNNEYPKLEAGTYLPGKTISVWPSWKKSFQKKLAPVMAEYSVFDSLPKDPINRLSRCSGAETPEYNQITCWDETEKIFAGSASESSITLPTYTGSHPYKDAEKTFSSHAYTYVHGSFNTCTPLETQGVEVEGFGTGPCSVDTNISTQRETANNPPVINCGTMSAHPNSEFSKYIQASDPDNDSLSNWELETIGDWSSWSSEPELRSAGIDSYREIYAAQAGAEGRYQFNVSVTDSEGASSERTCEVVVGNAAPTISFSPCDGNIKVGEEYNCTLKAYDPDGDDLDYNVSGLPPCLNFDSGTISGMCDTSDAGEYTINVSVSDGYGESDSSSFDFNIRTYCGDNIVQTPNMKGQYEECDDGGDNGEPCEPAYGSSCSYCNDSCEVVTRNAPTNCGDGTVQEDQEEECDKGENNGEPCEPAYGSSCTYCNSLCKEQKIVGPYCGDGTVQGPEQCETPDDCPHGEYECNDCECGGGYCGDGTIQPEYEACELAVDTNTKRAALDERGVPGVSHRSDEKIEKMYNKACSGCQFLVPDWEKLGLGCYIEGEACEKGTYIYDADSGEWICDSFDPPLYDYCCVNPNNPEEDGTSLHDLSYEVVYPSTSYPGNSSFRCDNICQSMGKVCVGVGLMDSNTNYCKSIKHHEPPYTTCADGTSGKDCTNSINVMGNDCKTTYSQDANHCVNCAGGSGYWFTVGGTACYCY